MAEFSELQRTKLDEILKTVQKKFGAETATVIGIENKPYANVEWIPVDSPDLNHLLGNGVPRGRMIEIYGPESSGKTSIACYLCGQVQKTLEKSTGGLCAYIDVENAIDPEYAKTFGFDIEKAILCQPSSGEEALDIAESLIEQNTDIVVIDSVAALTPQAEINGEMGDQQIGLQARLMSKACRKFTSLLATHKTTVIWINQIRMKIGVMYGNPECVTPDTLIDLMTTQISMENLFKACNVDWATMKPGDWIDVSDKNFMVKSFDELTKDVVRRKVLRLVRKENVPVYEVRTSEGALLFRASPAHKIQVSDTSSGLIGWKSLEDILGHESLYHVHFSDGTFGFVQVIATNDVQPILDMEIEDSHTYFANGVLSHNTTAGGNPLKFDSTIRLEVRTKEYIEDPKKGTYGIRSRVKAVKNKVAPPMRVCQLEIFFGQGIQVERSWVNFAIAYDVIKKAGAGWMTLPNGDRIQGLDKVVALFREQPELYQDIVKQTKERMSTNPMLVVNTDSEESEK